MSDPQEICFPIILKSLSGIIHLCLSLRRPGNLFLYFYSYWLTNRPVADAQHSWTLLRSNTKRVRFLSHLVLLQLLDEVLGVSQLRDQLRLLCSVEFLVNRRWILIHYSQNNNQHLLSTYHKDPRASWSRRPGLESVMLGNGRLEMYLPETLTCKMWKKVWLNLKNTLHIQ